MVRTKGLAKTTANWKASHGRVPAAYSDGITRTEDWQGKAIEGKANYEAGITAAIARGAREAGISAVPNEQWKSAALKKGAARIVEGMRASEGKYNTKMGTVISTIEGVSIPARVQDPNANIDNRLKPIANALHKLRTG